MTTSASEKLQTVVDYKLLPRRRLQQLCKKNGIPANKTNLFMAEALSDLAVVQSSMLSKTSMDSSMQSPLFTRTGNDREPSSVTTIDSVSFNPSGQKKRGRPRKQRPIELDQDLQLNVSKCETLLFNPTNLENQMQDPQAEKVDASAHGDVSNASDRPGESRNQHELEARREALRTLLPNLNYKQVKGVLDSVQPLSDAPGLLQSSVAQHECFADGDKESASKSRLSETVPCEGKGRMDPDTQAALLVKSSVQSEVEGTRITTKIDPPEDEVHVNVEADLYISGIDKKFEKNPTADKLDNESSRRFELSGTAPCETVVADKEMVDVDGTAETGETSLKVEETFTCVLLPSTVDDDSGKHSMVVICTDEQQPHVKEPASEMIDVVEVSQQEDPPNETEYGIEVRGDSRIEGLGNPCPRRLQLQDSFVNPDDSSMVSIQVNYQAPSNAYSMDSSMHSPEVMKGTVVGELNSVNTVDSVSSNPSEQNLCAMPLMQHAIMLDQDLVPKVSSKGDAVFSNLAHAENQTAVSDTEMVEASSHGDVSIDSDPGESRDQQHPSLETQIKVPTAGFDDQQAKVVVPESDQSLSDIEVVTHKSIIHNEFEDTSNAAGSADKDIESPRVSGISEAVPSAIAKSKEVFVDAEAALYDFAVQSEFPKNPTTIEDNDSSRCELLETVPYEFATGDCKVDLDDIPETPSATPKRDSSLKVEELCTYPPPLLAEEPSVRERIAAPCTEEPFCSTRSQSGASNFQNEEGDVDMLEDYDIERNVHVDTEYKGTSSTKRSAGKDNECSRGSVILETVPFTLVENKEVVDIKPPFCKSTVQNKFENSPTADEDDERSKELELLEEVHGGVVIIERKEHLDHISEIPDVILGRDSIFKIIVAGCEDVSTCPALGHSDSSSLQNAEGDVNMIEEAAVREVDTGVQPVVHSVCHNELEATLKKKCSTEKDKENSRGSGILETVPCAMLMREVEGDADVTAPSYKSSVQNEFEKNSTALNEDDENSRFELLGTNPAEIVISKWVVDVNGRADVTLERDSYLKVVEVSADALLLSTDEASVKQRAEECCTDQPMDPTMGQSDASSLQIVEGDVDMLEESDAESLYRNTNQARCHQHVGAWVDVQLQVSPEPANPCQTDELLFQSVERNVNFLQETNSGLPIRKINYEGCGDQVELSNDIASKDASIGQQEEESERSVAEGLVKTLTTEYDQERLQRRTKLPSSYADQFKKSPFVRLSRLSSNDLTKVITAGSVKRAKILAGKRATTPQHLQLLDKVCNTTLEPVPPGKLKSAHFCQADALVQSVEGKETESEIAVGKISDVACASDVENSTTIGAKDSCTIGQEQEPERSASEEGLIEKLTTEYAQERLQRRNKLVSSYLDQFKKSPFVKLSRLSSNDVAKVISAGSIKRAQILAEKRATPQRPHVLDKTHSMTPGSVLLHGEEDSGYVSPSPTETTRSMMEEDITEKI